MAWDPNEKNSYAWFTKEASEHGGVENYINDIEENAKYEAHIEDLVWVVPLLAFGALIKTGVDWTIRKIKTHNDLKIKSNIAKEKLTAEYENTETTENDDDVLKVNEEE